MMDDERLETATAALLPLYVWGPLERIRRDICRHVRRRLDQLPYSPSLPIWRGLICNK